MAPLSIILFLIPKPVSLIAASGCHRGAGMSKGAALALNKFSFISKQHVELIYQIFARSDIQVLSQLMSDIPCNTPSGHY